MSHRELQEKTCFINFYESYSQIKVTIFQWCKESVQGRRKEFKVCNNSETQSALPANQRALLSVAMQKIKIFSHLLQIALELPLMAVGGNSASSSLVVFQLRLFWQGEVLQLQSSQYYSVSATAASAGVVVTVAKAAEVLAEAVLALSPYYILQLNHLL